MSKHVSIPEKMQKYSELIKNSISDSNILEGIAEYGYSLNKLNTGEAIYEQTLELIAIHGNEDAEEAHGDNNFKLQRNKVKTSYSKYRKLAKLALEDKPLLLKVNLGVNGEVSTAYAEWIKDVELFYGNALKSEDIMTAFAEYNLTEEKLQAEQEEIAILKNLKLKQKKEMGEAQMATKERDKKIAELDKWASKYKKVVHIAFEDQPQILEKLGILVRS